jgi:peptide/nickel transport system ATP-binding protein
MDNILEIKDLTVHYEMETSVVEAVNGVSLSMKKGETLGLVGETGAGKTTIALSIMGLLDKKRAHILKGEVFLKEENLLEKSEAQMRKVRGEKVSMIFQDPMTALNPVVSVGAQIAEVISLHNKCSKKQAIDKAKEMLEMVGIPSYRFKEYPHQFSGGMKQRVIIAIALACNPQLLIADEPTTALDVTIQAQILELMKEEIRKREMSVIMITHDLGVVAEICDKCAVMYAGEIVEYGTVENILDNPQHPYTKNLLNSLPSIEGEVHPLQPIEGAPSDPTNLPEYCSFCDRCRERIGKCSSGEPSMVEVEPGHFAKCYLFAEG